MSDKKPKQHAKGSTMAALQARFALTRLLKMPRPRAIRASIALNRPTCCDRCGDWIMSGRCIAIKGVGLVHEGCS